MADVYNIKSVYTKYTYGLMNAQNLVHEVYDLYLAYGLRTMKYTTCTGRMADVHSVLSMFTK